eukprot:176754_1
MCTMNIIYAYNDKIKITKEFPTKYGKKMLIDTNLILQYIDQRKMNQTKQGLAVYINMKIKYQHMNHEGSKSAIRTWRYNLTDYSVEIGHCFNWKITRDLSLTSATIYASSLWFQNTLQVQTNYKEIAQFGFICHRNILIDQYCRISIHKDVVMSCDILTVHGRINASKPILMITNRTNLTHKNFHACVSNYSNVKFGFIQEEKKAKESLFGDLRLYYWDISQFEKQQNKNMYSYNLIDQMPLIKFGSFDSQVNYLKSKLFLVTKQNNDNDRQQKKELVLSDLWSSSNQYWIKPCLSSVIKDARFVEKIKLFSDSHEQKMSLFEFLFFKCGYYEIANYVAEYGYKSQGEIYEILIETDFFIKDEHNWIQSVDRRQRLCSQYLPTACGMEITYVYDNNHKVRKAFSSEKAIPMLINTNLILQYVDQKQIYKLIRSHATESEWKGVVISMDIDIQYGPWKYMVNNFTVDIGTEFKWKINHSSSLSVDTVWISSLWITNNSCISTNANAGQFTIGCQENALIDEKCSISMDERGLKGAYVTISKTDKAASNVGKIWEKTKSILSSHGKKQQVDKAHKCNGKSGDNFGGGAGYKEQGQNGVNSFGSVDASGGCKYFTDSVDSYETFSVGFGGGCAKKEGSRGGNGGGKIV